VPLLRTRKTSSPSGRAAKAGNKYELLAAREVVRLAGEVEPRAVVEVVGAMIMAGIMEPRWFKGTTRSGYSWPGVFGG
jgi:hypothetical protein